MLSNDEAFLYATAGRERNGTISVLSSAMVQVQRGEQAQREYHILIFGIKNDAHLHANAGLAAGAIKTVL